VGIHWTDDLVFVRRYLSSAALERLRATISVRLRPRVGVRLELVTGAGHLARFSRRQARPVILMLTRGVPDRPGSAPTSCHRSLTTYQACSSSPYTTRSRHGFFIPLPKCAAGMDPPDATILDHTRPQSNCPSFCHHLPGERTPTIPVLRPSFNEAVQRPVPYSNVFTTA